MSHLCITCGMSLQGEPISIILGTNHDEMALFMIAMPLLVPGIKMPSTRADMLAAAEYTTK